MDLRIVGLDPSEVDFEPDKNPGGLRAVLPGGGDALFLAADLLDVVAPEKGARLRQILDHELVPGEGLEQVILEVDVGHIYFLLEDVEDDALVVTDEHWRLRAEHVDAVRSRAPELVYTFTDEDGHTVHTLANTVSTAITVRNVLYSAMMRGLKVILS